MVFGEYDGCESGDGVCGWGVGVGVLEVVSGVRMGVGVGSVGNRGEGVVKSRGSASVAGGRARWRDCCRFPDWIFGELWEGLPSSLPLTLDISDVYL